MYVFKSKATKKNKQRSHHACSRAEQEKRNVKSKQGLEKQWKGVTKITLTSGRKTSD